MGSHCRGAVSESQEAADREATESQQNVAESVATGSHRFESNGKPPPKEPKARRQENRRKGNHGKPPQWSRKRGDRKAQAGKPHEAVIMAPGTSS